jgi:solute carrier family 13 (sodium-dependent dicarboxylate transporter), member 2/3/5
LTDVSKTATRDGKPSSRDEKKPDMNAGSFGPFGLAAILAGPLAAIAVLFLPAPEGLPPEGWRMTAVAVWMVVWWLTEAIPIPATALLPLVAMPLLDVLPLADVAPSYADPVVFLFLGGFLLAGAMQKVGLHRRLALVIVAAIGTSPQRIILGFMVATAFLSMWISNTATAVMMFAVGKSVIDFVSDRTDDDAVIRNFGIALMLSIAYAASIGGIGTLIGTPPNAFLASFMRDQYDIEISFFTWMLFGVPIVLIALPIAWLLLTRFLFPADLIAIEDAGGGIRSELKALGPMRPGEKLVGAVFILAALAWILRVPLANWTGLALDDTIIAILAALILFAVPVNARSGEVALDWEATRNVPWGVLLLFGGGLALASGFAETGLAAWIGDAVAGLEISTLVLIFVVTAAMVFLTEITSNTASSATFLPILGAVAVGLGLDPMMLAVPVAVAASMAFMMPVATPPNAIVFSYERMQLSDMVRAGIWMNVVAIILIYGLFLTLGRLIFGLGD